MAPITASIIGFPTQQIDDERLRSLIQNLSAINEESEDLLQSLATTVEPWTKWLVEEQVSFTLLIEYLSFGDFRALTSFPNNRWISTTGSVR